MRLTATGGIASSTTGPVGPVPYVVLTSVITHKL